MKMRRYLVTGWLELCQNAEVVAVPRIVCYQLLIFSDRDLYRRHIDQLTMVSLLPVLPLQSCLQ